MTARALTKFIRISPFKVRRIANEVVKKDVISAESYLSVLTNKGALALKKVIYSARTNYLTNNSGAVEENLYIDKILVDQGPMLKRFHPIGRGRVQRILKRTCHILVEVAEKEGDK